MKKWVLAWLTGGCFMAMALFPQSVYMGARQGLSLWAQVLVPSLLPFFILAEILMASGLLQLLGRLLSPIMEPLFHLPGAAGLGVALGYSSGFPMGAVISRRLCQGGYLDSAQASRLLAFTNNSSPGFILTSLAAGMLHSPAAGWLLALCHYGANLIYGLLLGRWAPRPKPSVDPAKKTPLSQTSLSLILTESIHCAIQNVLTLGGYVLVFSVGLNLLRDLQLLWPLAAFFQLFLPVSLIQGPLSQAFAVGVFEMTLGLNQLSSLPLPLIQQVPYCLIFLGWSGLAIQAQILGITSGSGLQLRYYWIGRFLQPLISLLLFRLCLGWLSLSNL